MRRYGIMKLGILVNTDKHLADVIGITEAAQSQGHEVAIFTMDEGTRLLEDPCYVGLSELKGVTMSFCDHSATQLKVLTSDLPDQIIRGGQYNNSVMNHESDKVIIM